MLSFILVQLLTFCRIFGLYFYMIEDIEHPDSERVEIVFEFKFLQFIAGVCALTMLSYTFFKFFTWLQN
jgi:hypothetical protein